MNWLEEEVPKIDREKSIKKYIKGELTNYYLYLDKLNEIRSKTRPLYGQNPGGSVIKMPNGSQACDGIQHRTIIHNEGVYMDCEPFIEKLERIDNWMNILTESQHNVVKVYVMKYQCEDTHRAALELQFAEDTVKKYTNRAINRIYSRINKIL